MKIWLRDALFDHEREAFTAALRARGHEIAGDAADAEAVVTGGVTLAEEELQAMPALRRVVRFATARADVVREDRILAARGIDAVHVRGGSAASTAEHALAMILSLLRRLPQTTEAMLEGRWCQSAIVGEGIHDLRECTAGVVGFGEVGRRLAELLRACGARVLHARRQADGASVPLDVLLAQCDVVCLAARTDPAERPLLTRARLALLRDGAIVVSVGSGGDVDLDALREQVDAGRLRAALDVFPQEPADPATLPRRRGAVVLSPHVAGRSRATTRALADGVAAVIEPPRRTAAYLRAVTAHVAARVALTGRAVAVGQHLPYGVDAAYAAAGARVVRADGDAVVVDGRRITQDDVFAIPLLARLRDRWWSDFGVWEQLFEQFARSRISGRTAAVIGYATPAAQRIAARARGLGMRVTVVAASPEERLDAMLDGYEAATSAPAGSIEVATVPPPGPPRGLDDEIAATFLALAGAPDRVEEIVGEAILAARGAIAAAPAAPAE
jgi:D-3-phosphoglycerate dehydrogenase